jgi:hypothetical protein
MESDNLTMFLRYTAVIFITVFGIITITASGSGDDDYDEPPTSWEKEIGPEGGTLEVTESESPLYGMKIEVPAGALAQQATITISQDTSSPLPEGFDDSYPVANITSDSPFQEDVKITFPIMGTPSNDGEVLSAFYYRTSDGIWTIVPAVEISDTQLVIETDHLSLWRWGTVTLEDVEPQTVTAAMQEMFTDYVDLEPAAVNKMATFTSMFNDLLVNFQSYTCQERQNVANVLNAIINQTKPGIETYVNDPNVINACNPDYVCTLGHMLITDENMGLKKWAEVEIRGVFGEAFWSMLPGVGGFGGDVLMEALGKALIDGQYQGAVEHELGCDYRCIFKNGTFDFYLNVIVCNLSYVALFALDMADAYYNPCTT